MNNQSEFLRIQKLFEPEKDFWDKGFRLVCGIDEAGRGALAGPVVASAVVFESETFIEGIDDSKKLSAKKREKLCEEIKQKAKYFGIGIVWQARIDEINILQATFEAMQKAVSELPEKPDFLLVDGNQKPKTEIPTKTIIKGDSLCFSIACASILAKVTRDKLMENLVLREQDFYGFRQNKGYGTKFHREKITELGYSEFHRKSFKLKELTQLKLF
ncbi:ribonuclease HII [bacterium]|nr:ribonuclease HII [bacterium]